MSHSPIPIVGQFFRPPAKAILGVLPSGCPLTCIPEPDNPYDPNAIQVCVASSAIPQDQLAQLEADAAGFGFSLAEILDQESWHLGYIPKALAAVLAPKLAGRPHPATLTFTADGKPAVALSLEPPT